MCSRLSSWTPFPAFEIETPQIRIYPEDPGRVPTAKTKTFCASQRCECQPSCSLCLGVAAAEELIDVKLANFVWNVPGLWQSTHNKCASPVAVTESLAGEQAQILHGGTALGPEPPEMLMLEGW